jgi:hypothetical protein
MATRTGMTQTAVSRIWRAFGLKPHKVDYWKLSTDPNFIDKLYDVVGLYLNPPDDGPRVPGVEGSKVPRFHGSRVRGCQGSRGRAFARSQP